MVGKEPIFVLAPDILTDYINIIPSPDDSSSILEEPTIDLSHAHLVIPSVVVRELANLQKMEGRRKHDAREVLRRLEHIFINTKRAMEDYYYLQAPVTVGEQCFSILPVHVEFTSNLPFCPDKSDIGGQIILAALTIKFLGADLSIYDSGRVQDLSRLPNNVVLLTNDNGLTIRARGLGITTLKYSYNLPAPYTGRRDIEVPEDFFMDFFNSHEIPATEFAEYLPREPRLVANEYIVMKLPSHDGYSRESMRRYMPDFNNIGRYDAESGKIVHLQYAKYFPVIPKNPGQAIYAESLMMPEIAAVVCSGPAGSGKTFMPTVYGYKACAEGKYLGIAVVPCENRGKYGALPGDLEQKMDPSVQPYKNALRNYLIQEENGFRKELENLRKFGTGTKCWNDEAVDQSRKRAKSNNNEIDEQPCRRSLWSRLNERVDDMIWPHWFTSIPIEVAQGRDFAYTLAIYDEFQDQNRGRADTLIKRLGMDGKIVITGDVNQIHTPHLNAYNNGLTYASELLKDNPMVAQVCFLSNEIVRHPLVQFIAERQEARRGSIKR